MNLWSIAICYKKFSWSNDSVSLEVKKGKDYKRMCSPGIWMLHKLKYFALILLFR